MTRILQVTGIPGRPLLLDGKPMHEGANVQLEEQLIPPVPGGRAVRGIYIDGEPQYDIVLLIDGRPGDAVRIGECTPELEADYAALEQGRAR